jgi:glycerate dehydrogenase
MAELLVVTDGHTLNPGDLSWDDFKKYGKVEVYERSSPSEVTERCRNATLIITNKTPVDASLIAACPKLKLIAVTATGYNIIDIEAARKRNIIVCNVPGYGTVSVAQHTFALILELVNHAGENARTVAEGKWSTSKDWCYTVAPIVELSGKTLGIVGLGNIGGEVAKIGAAFGMRVIFSNPRPKQSGYEQVSVEELFSRADVISLHCPLTADNKQFVNAALLSLMKRSACLINTSRGMLINESDLATALRNGTIAGAGLDVLSTEPPRDNPLIGSPRCIITPHNAWLSFESRSRMMAATLANVEKTLAGRPQNVVNA